MGVWIETILRALLDSDIKVTPRVGVWIETLYIYCHPQTVGHSPCGSVDWNIDRIGGQEKIETSLPVWECGLKPSKWYCNTSCRRSLPVWECGLKQIMVKKDWKQQVVTPRVGVWIETALFTNCCVTNFGHSPCGSVDWNMMSPSETANMYVTPRVGVWIETKVESL